MNRLEKKCLIASAGTHSLLFVLVVFGSAFFVSHDKSISTPPLHALPTKLIDEALSGGGGNPKIAPSEDQQKGQTLVPQPPQPARVEPRPPTPPVPKPEIQPAPIVKIDKPKPVKPAKEPPKEPAKPKPDTATAPPLNLKPVTRPSIDKAAIEKAKQAEAQAKALADARRRAAVELGKAAQELKSGFSQGTKVEISGPGGEAYADYSQFVKSVYEDAWVVSDDLTDESSTAKVSVTIAKSGHVISARIERHSGNSPLDRSVQRALDKVRFVAPFPAGALDEQRTFIINFNLKAKRLLG